MWVKSMPYKATLSQLPSELDLILADVIAELDKASATHGPFPTALHGLAVLEEEVDEFKYEVRHGTKERRYAEAIQVSAMAIRFLIDCQ